MIALGQHCQYISFDTVWTFESSLPDIEPVNKQRELITNFKFISFLKLAHIRNTNFGNLNECRKWDYNYLIQNLIVELM